MKNNKEVAEFVHDSIGYAELTNFLKGSAGEYISLYADGVCIVGELVNCIDPVENPIGSVRCREICKTDFENFNSIDDAIENGDYSDYLDSLRIDMIESIINQ